MHAISAAVCREVVCLSRLDCSHQDDNERSHDQHTEPCCFARMQIVLPAMVPLTFGRGIVQYGGAGSDSGQRCCRMCSDQSVVSGGSRGRGGVKKHSPNGNPPG